MAYIRAPMEADAQIAFLIRKGVAQIAYSENTDLLVHGVSKLLFGVDFFTNKASMIELDDLWSFPQAKRFAKTELLHFTTVWKSTGVHEKPSVCDTQLAQDRSR